MLLFLLLCLSNNNVNLNCHGVDRALRLVHHAVDCNVNKGLILRLVVNGVLMTPSQGCLSGTTRLNLHKALRDNKSDVKGIECDIPYENLLAASEAFFTSRFIM